MLTGYQILEENLPTSGSSKCIAQCVLTASVTFMPHDNSLRKLVVVLQVAPTPMVEAPTCPPRQSLPTGASNSRLSGAPRAAPPGFERHSPQVQTTPLSCLLETRPSGDTCLDLEVCSAKQITCSLHLSPCSRLAMV